MFMFNVDHSALDGGEVSVWPAIRGCRRAPRRDLGCGGAPFKRRRTDLAQGRMSASLVIEHFDVVEQLPLGFAAAVEVLAELELYGGEEALHHRVVIAVAAAAHA